MTYTPANIIFKNDDLDTILIGLEMDQVKNVSFQKFLPIITQAINKNKKECIFCFVDNYQIIIPKSSYKSVLNTLEQHYVKNEDFITCSKIIDLINKIKE